MSQAIAVAIAEKLKDLLIAGAIAGDFSQAVRAERKYYPKISLKDGDGDGVLVIVTPAIERETERDTLTTWQDTHKLAIGINRHVSNQENSTVDPLMLLAEQICNYSGFEQFALSTGHSAQLTERAQPVVYDPEMLRTNRDFYSLISLTFWVSQSFGIS